MQKEQIGQATLFCGDCRDVLPVLPPTAALITDPPYGIGLGHTNNPRRDATHLGKRGYASSEDTYAHFVEAIVPRLNAFLDRYTPAAVFTGPHFHEQRKPHALGGIVQTNAVGRTPWGSKNLLPILFYGTPPRAGQHHPTLLLSTTAAEPSSHPCPKPLPWLLWLVELSTRPGTVVCDPFMGSGTTGVACSQLQRPFIGIEIEPRYFDIACQRLETAHRQGQLFPARVTPPPPVQLTLQEE